MTAMHEPPWSVVQTRTYDGRDLIYFEYKGHTVGRFEGSIENAQWIVTCVNAAHACYIPMSEGVAQEAGYQSMGDVFAALDRQSS